VVVLLFEFEGFDGVSVVDGFGDCVVEDCVGGVFV